MDKRRATAADVAEAAGVSKTTVSYAFSDTKHHKLTEDTRLRVVQIADRLGYRPNPVARALRQGSSKVALALLPDWDMGPSWARTIQELGDMLAARGFALVAASAASVESIPLWRQLTPSVVMALGDLSPSLTTEIADAGVPLADIDLRGMLRLGGRLGAAALHEAGHERIGYLLPPTPVPREIEQYRFEGIEAYCAENGLPLPPRRVLEYSTEGLQRLRGAWLDKADGVTGIVAHTDEVGVFVYLALHEAGYPLDRVQVIGVGDRPLAQLGLTTIGFDSSAVTRTLAEGALALLEGRDPNPQPPLDRSIYIVHRDSLPARGHHRTSGRAFGTTAEQPGRR